MPSKSAKQERFMRAVAHGWKPTHKGVEAPPVSVAKEFVEADKKYSGGFAENRYYTGGLAAMNMQGGGFTGIGGMVKRVMERAQMEKESPGSWLGSEPMNFQQFRKKIGASGAYSPIQVMATAKKYGWTSVPGEGGDFKKTMWYPPEPTLLGPRDGGRRDGRGGRGGRRGRDGPPPPPRMVPPTGPPPDYVPPDRRAGRDTPYSEALRAHRERVATALGVPSGSARGGHVKNYQEGGEVRPGHAEGANPYPEGSARYNLWERKYHVDPAPPPVAEAPEPEDLSWLERLLRPETERRGRTERELEELEEAHGGYIDAPGYQYGGLAAANFRRPPGGGIPPRAMLPQPTGNPYGATTSPVGPIDRGMIKPMPPNLQRELPWRGAPPPRIAPPPGKFPRGRFPGRGSFFPGRGSFFPGRGSFPGRGGYEDYRRGPINPRGVPIAPGGQGPYRGIVDALWGAGGAGAAPTGVPGGARVPPNMRGFLQRMRMMNRPPANVGGGVNRVGMQDQQGGLARALQRGTGRPPMSRRAGFPGRSLR